MEHPLDVDGIHPELIQNNSGMLPEKECRTCFSFQAKISMERMEISLCLLEGSSGSPGNEFNGIIHVINKY